jgi:D-alanyl-lipoteichoic acid acyltransferase DltB (MBOAT superfamily)
MEAQAPERHIGRFALYMAFFPKLLQGPIERCSALVPQLGSSFRFDYDKVRSGLFLFGRGLFCKVVIAERVGRYVDFVYDDVHGHSGITLLLATYAYAIQLYCDFSGYTDMARGTARIFNIDLAENFNHPYVATSIADFWRRWHMSFSRWLLDYIFNPLQMACRRMRRLGTALALAVTFAACGLWHGAGWTFMIWGLLHGAYLTASLFYRPYRERLHSALRLPARVGSVFQAFVTFNLVCFGWIFFRANNVADAVYIVRNMFAPAGWTLREGVGFFFQTQVLLGRGIHNLVPLGLVMAVILTGGRDWLSGIQRRRRLVRWPVYVALCYAIVVFGIWDSSQRFVYFAF